MDPASELLLQAPTEVRLGPAGDAPEQSARSHLGDGRCISWSPRSLPPGLHVALDAELADRCVPAALSVWAGGLPSAVFWERWTRVETSCKLREVPVVLWLRRHGLHEDPALALRTFRHGPAVVTCGAAHRQDVTGLLTAGGERPRPASVG